MLNISYKMAFIRTVLVFSYFEIFFRVLFPVDLFIGVVVPTTCS